MTNQGKNEFSTIYSAVFNASPRSDAAVQSVVDPCNIVSYLHFKNPYLHSISHTLCNKYILYIYIYIIILSNNPADICCYVVCCVFVCVLNADPGMCICSGDAERLLLGDTALQSSLHSKGLL